MSVSSQLALASWGGTGYHYFAGTNFKPRKMPENAAYTPSRLHPGMMASVRFPRENALLAGFVHFEISP
jgi:hypothetical protein